MQNKQTSLPPPSLRTKANSFKHSRINSEFTHATHPHFDTLSFSMDLSHSHPSRHITIETLLTYTEQVIESVYEKDIIGIKNTFRKFMKQSLGDLKGRLQERLSLLKYLEESLRYKSFGEIETEVVKEWRKNALFYSLSTIWARCVLNGKFKSEEGFVSEYDRYRTLIANLSHFYFKGSLKILSTKGFDTLALFFDDTSHQIIAALKDWNSINDSLLLPILTRPQEEINLDFPLCTLKVNPHYLDLNHPGNQLPQTTKCIHQFASDFRIHDKIASLKAIRAAFIKEITQNCNRMALERGQATISQLEKDDILDCMIYCIIKGQIREVGNSLRSLLLLVGKNSELLSKKGVDCYRADLQGAVQYLSEEQPTSPLMRKNHTKHLMSTQLTFSPPS